MNQSNISDQPYRFWPRNDEWVYSADEEPFEPDIAVVDPHHHLFENHILFGRYLLEDIGSDVLSGHPVRATVYVEAKSHYWQHVHEQLKSVGETEYADRVAEAALTQYPGSGICAGIVGRADLRLGDMVAPVLEAHIQTAPKRFRGIRFGVGWDPDPRILPPNAITFPNLMQDINFRKGFAQLGKYGLSYDAFNFQHQLPELVDLVRAVPGTRVILNHLGCPTHIGRFEGKFDSVFSAWREQMKRLAECDDVFVKLGAMVSRRYGFDFGNRQTPPGSEELEQLWFPYVDACVQAFGSKRCMFESNFPVDRSICTYTTLWNALKRLALRYSREDADWLLCKTAATAYRLEVSPEAVAKEDR